MITIEKRKLVSFLIFTLFNIILFLILKLIKPNIQIVTYLSTLQLLATLILLKFNRNSILSISYIFLGLSYFFHFGQAIIVAYGFNDIYAHRSILAITSENSFLMAMYFAMISQFFITLGMLSITSSSMLPLKIKENEKQMLHILKIISTIVLIVTVFPLIYLDTLKIFAVQTSGYISTYETYSFGINKYLNLIAQFARPAVTILLISFHNDKKKANILFGISTLYFIFMMISGDRGTNLIYLITNTFVYFKIIRKLTLKKIIIYAIIGYFFLGFLSTISILRDTSNISVEGIIYYFRYRSSDGIIYSALREFGLTMKTLIYSIELTSVSSQYNYGLTYLLSWLNLFPKLPEGISDSLINHFTFIRSFPNIYQESLGGSYLGELFYNFGWYGSAIAFFVGRFIGYTSNSVENSIRQKNWIVFSILMVLFPNILLWIRGYFVELTFRTFWFGLFILFMYVFMRRRTYNKES